MRGRIRLGYMSVKLGKPDERLAREQCARRLSDGNE